MPRKRQEPSQTKLPKYVYIRRGWYIYRPYLGGGTLGKDVKLCQANADISTVWKRYEQITTPSATRKTLDWLFIIHDGCLRPIANHS